MIFISRMYVHTFVFSARRSFYDKVELLWVILADVQVYGLQTYEGANLLCFSSTTYFPPLYTLRTRLRLY